MTTVTAIKLRYNPKTLWFDPQECEYLQGDYVLVETERGREVGLVVEGALEASAAQIKKLKSPLKPVVRKLSDIDFDHLDALDAKGKEALAVFRELIIQHQMDIKAVQVEYLFSGDKAIFYFASDVRVDFRDLVRDLAAHFHIRVDMRQIGARDEARMVGGLAHCGEELCCARLGCEFQPVSIRMAKEQDLPLNPVKISGACGRLMCCLRYEFEAYKEFKQRAPKKGSLVETPLGDATITDYDTPREIIHLRLSDGKSLAIPLARMDCQKNEKGCACNCRVSREAIDQCAPTNIMLALSALDRENEKLEDTLYDEEAGLNDKSYERGYAGAGTRVKRRRRRSEAERGGGQDEGDEADDSSAALGAGGYGTRRGSSASRKRSADAGTGAGGANAGGAGSAGGANAGSSDGTGNASAGGAKAAGSARRASGTGRASSDSKNNQQSKAGERTKGRNRRRRSDAQGSTNQTFGGADDLRSRASQAESLSEKPRPGQRSSGVRNPQKQSRVQSQSDSRAPKKTVENPAAAAETSSGSSQQAPSHRRRRRRSGTN